MNIRTFLPLFLAVAVISCEAQNDTITSSLFEMSAASASTVSGSVNMRSGSIRIAEPVSFYDSGGPSGNYGNNLNQVLTVYPDRPGERVVLGLQSFDIEDEPGCPYDVFEIYNGTSTSSPQLESFCGSLSQFFVPFYFVASNSTGALTIRFKSDGSDNLSGWSASLYTLTNSTAYSVALPRALGLPANSSWVYYNVFGPSTLPTDQGFCISTSNSVPSRTNGASCYTANVNRYGTRWFTQPGLGFSNQLHYMRAFVTPPGGATLYTSTVTYSPLSKALPFEFNRLGDFDTATPLRPIN